MYSPPVIDLRGDKDEALKFLQLGKQMLQTLRMKKRLNGVMQDRLYNRPRPHVRMLVEENGGIARILIEARRKVGKVFKDIFRWYWYHVIQGGYRWYINDLCVDSAGMIYIIGGHAVTNPAIWYGDYAVIVQYTPDGIPTYVKRWDKSPLTTDPKHGSFVEDTDWCFGHSIVGGEPGYLYALVDWARDNTTGLYESMLVKLSRQGAITWDIGVGDSGNQTQVYGMNVQYWYEVISDTRHDYVYSLYQFKDFSPTSGGTILMGLLCKHDEDGTEQWKKFFRFAFAASPLWIRADDMDVDGDGNAYVLCRTYNDPITSWLGDFTVLKFDKTGSLTWRKTLGPATRTGDITTVAHEIVADSYGNVYVIMVERERTSATEGYMKYVLVSIESDGSAVTWAKKFQVDYSNNESAHDDVYPRLAEGLNGDIFLLAQAVDDSVSGDDDYILTKYDSDGNNVWLERLHGVDWGVNIGGMAVDRAGDIILGGDVYSQDRSFTMKLPDGPLAGTFHNFEIDRPTYTIGNHSMSIATEVSLTVEDATDMDVQTVDYVTDNLDNSPDSLRKFLEEKQTVEVFNG